MISVIVPVYRVERYLDRCVESIVSQTYRDLEILLVDDGSPDRCGEMCDAWAKRDARIRVIHKQNGGLSDARNAGIDAAEGELLSFIDSDDYIEPDMLENLCRALNEQAAQVAVCNFVAAYPDGNRPEKDGASFDKPQFREEQTLSSREYLLQARGDLRAVSVVAWNKLYRRELFARLRYPKGRLHEDEFVFHHLFYPCDRIVCIPENGYHYLQRPDSIINGEKQLLLRKDMLDALLDRARYFCDCGDRELALRCDDNLLVKLKKARQAFSRTELRIQRRGFARLALRLFRKGWISFRTLCKRLVRGVIL